MPAQASSRPRTLSGWSKPVCNQSELGDGQMLLLNVGSERVVVGRCAEGLFAFSDHCAHRLYRVETRRGILESGREYPTSKGR
jgi:nitrite reductase/ring-hydroxylating ferredoxin subunit